MRWKSSLNQFRINSSRTNVERLYRERNHPFARVEVDAKALTRGDVVFTVTEDTSNMDAFMVLSGSGGVLPGSTSTCVYSLAGAVHLITCDTPNTVAIADVTKVGLTVVSK